MTICWQAVKAVRKPHTGRRPAEKTEDTTIETYNA